MKRSEGFTLVEVMIVVSIIALLATLAVPNVLRARVNSNETCAIEAMRTLSTALESFRGGTTPSTYPGPGVTSGGVAVTGLAGLGNTVPAYIDPVLASSPRQGYSFAYTPGPVRVVALGGVNYNVYDNYTVNSNPLVVGITGNRRFYVDELGVLRVNELGPAGPGDLPID